MYTGSTKGTKKDFTGVLSDACMKERDMLECVQGLWDFGTLSADRSQAKEKDTLRSEETSSYRVLPGDSSKRYMGHLMQHLSFPRT